MKRHALAPPGCREDALRTLPLFAGSYIDSRPGGGEIRRGLPIEPGVRPLGWLWVRASMMPEPIILTLATTPQVQERVEVAPVAWGRLEIGLPVRTSMTNDIR